MAEYEYERLATRYLEDNDVKPLFHQGKYYEHDGTRYVEEKELTPKLSRFLLRAKISQSNRLVGNVTPIIRAIALKDGGTYGSMPFYFGEDHTFPKPDRVIAYTNGLLSLDDYCKGVVWLRPHTPLWASTVCLPYAFDPTAQCPQWTAFLSEVFEEDECRVKLLQEWFGYCLTQDVSQHKILCKLGVPRSGKGTVDRVHTQVVGESNCTGYNLRCLVSAFGLHRLVGQLVAFVGEVTLNDKNSKYAILEKLLSISGGDAQTIEEKHNPLCPSIILPTRFSLSCNELPTFNDPSGALASRLMILNFDRSFEGKEDKNLTAKLLAELAGINCWSLVGLKRLHESGRFTDAKHGKDLVTQFRRDNSDTFAFAQDCLIVSAVCNPGNLVGVEQHEGPVWATGADLTKVYMGWCETNCKEAHFGWLSRNLRTLMPKLEVKRKMIAGRQEQVYLGVGVKVVNEG